jgi:glycine dehydrogenase subunit 1
MQAREQHIRREKASSNICSNQALCALTSACYMAAMGPSGVAEAAAQCLSKAHYAAELLAAIPGFEPVYKGEFFHEFLTGCPCDAEELMAELAAHGILGGYPTEKGILWCFTEMNTKDEIDMLAELLQRRAGK